MRRRVKNRGRSPVTYWVLKWPGHCWFKPELNLPKPESLDNTRLHELLWETIHNLFSKRIVLDFTHHLSDRELFCLIYRDILPSREKKIERTRTFLHWLYVYVEISLLEGAPSPP